MTEDAKRARRDYQREWRRKNPTKNAQYCRDYWERRAAAEKKRDQATA